MNSAEAHVVFACRFPGEASASASASSGPLQSLLHHICWDAFDNLGQPSKWLRDSRCVCARLAVIAVQSASNKRQRQVGKNTKKARKNNKKTSREACRSGG